MARAREVRGLTQPQVAALLRTTQVRISRWERGEHRVSGPEFVTWADKLDPPLTDAEWVEFRAISFSDRELSQQRRRHAAIAKGAA